MLCANKIGVIYFCPNFVNFLPENAHFFIFKGGGGGDFPPACAPMPPVTSKMECLATIDND